MKRISAPGWIASRTLALMMLIMTGCGGISPARFSGDVGVLLERGQSFLDRLERVPGEDLSDAEVVALGYAERVRLGLGSPFRVVEYVQRDPDIPDEMRAQLTFGLLSRVMRGQTYFVDSRVLDLARPTGVPAGRSTGAQQLDLIERTIESAPSATAGERAVRIGYLLAGAERTVDASQTTVIAHVAALTADRRRAREDVSLLLRTASANEMDPVALLARWRRELRFQVEQPSNAAVTVVDELAEARNGPALALALRALAQRESGPGMRRAGLRAQSAAGRPLLDEVAATRLLELAVERNHPPQAPIAVAVAINSDGFVDRPGLRETHRAARARFAEMAWNEERLVASAAELQAAGAWAGARPSLIMVQAATFLRVWNQDEPWGPGDPAPTARELEARFGVEAITFDPDVAESWKPYYLRHLGRGFGDLQRVLPTVTLRGLRVHVGELKSGMSALALHEPRSRTLFLPPKTGAGTLAHELAHDLDWQLARKRYSVRGGYATDLAVRANRGDRIASAMMELSSSLAQPAAFGANAHGSRPAEVFARGADWLIATALAQEGRIGGYLTSFQDPVLTGYGTTRSPDISGAAVPALLSLLDGISPVPEATRDWILRHHGPRRSVSGAELSRAIVDAGSTLPPQQRLAEIQRVARRSFETVSNCRYGSSDALRQLVAAQHQLASASLSAAVRGAAIDAVHALAEQLAGESVRHMVDEWLAWRIYGAPEPVDPLLDELAPAFEDLLLHAQLIGEAGAVTTDGSAFQSVSGSPLCGGNPFAAVSPAVRLRG